MNRIQRWRLKRQIRRDYEEWSRNGARPIILPPDHGCPMCGRAFPPTLYGQKAGQQHGEAVPGKHHLCAWRTIREQVLRRDGAA